MLKLKKWFKKLRKNERLILFVLALFIALAFGVTTQMKDVLMGKGKEPRANLAGRIFDKDISRTEYQNLQACWKVLAQMQLGIASFDIIKAGDFDNQQEYLDELTWTAFILLELCERLEIKVTEQEIKGLIRFFFRDQEGGFDYGRYKAILQRSYQISPIVFEKAIEEFLKIRKYHLLVIDSVTVNLEEIYQEYVDINTRVRVRCVAFRPKDFIRRVKIKGSNEITQHFQNNAEKFRVPDKVQIEYLLADYRVLQKEVKPPTKEEIKKYYEAHREDYKIPAPEKEPESKPITPTLKYQLLEKVQNEISERLLKEKALDKAFDRIMKVESRITQLEIKKKGIDLKELAQEFNLIYNKTGFFSKDELPEIEKKIGTSDQFGPWVFTYQPDESGQIIQTDKEYYLLFRMLKKQAGYIPRLTSRVKDAVVKDLKRQKSIILAGDAAAELLEEINQKAEGELKQINDKPGKERAELGQKIRLRCFKKVATEKGLRLKETGYFYKGEDIPEIKETGFQFFSGVFKLEQKGDFNKITDLKEKKEIYYVAQLLERKSPRGDDFQDQRASLKSSLQQRKYTEFLREWFDTIKKQAGFKDYLKEPTTSEVP